MMRTEDNSQYLKIASIFDWWLVSTRHYYKWCWMCPSRVEMSSRGHLLHKCRLRSGGFQEGGPRPALLVT